METYGANSAALVMMDPNTGAIIASCSLPDFDPNNYSKVDSASVYANDAIFTPYEPGSVFKAITMASALDIGLVSPQTTFNDPCVRKFNGYEIRNALDKCYGTQTMTGVLENSINTGMIWVEEKMGNKDFSSYVDKFGFGKKTGITLNTEAAGDVSALEKKGQIFGAVGSFGQGITAEFLLPVQRLFSRFTGSFQIKGVHDGINHFFRHKPEGRKLSADNTVYAVLMVDNLKAA